SILDSQGSVGSQRIDEPGIPFTIRLGCDALQDQDAQWRVTSNKGSPNPGAHIFQPLDRRPAFILANVGQIDGATRVENFLNQRVPLPEFIIPRDRELSCAGTTIRLVPVEAQ